MTRHTLSRFVLLGGLLAAGCGGAATYARRPTPALAEGPGALAVVLVRIPAPWYAPRFVVRGKFRGALAEYEAMEPLVAKYFTISDEGEFGGLYLWKTREDAAKHFDATWRARVREQRGADADVLLLDAPYVLEGHAAPTGTPIGARSMEFPASASLVLFELPAGADGREGAKALAAGEWANDALVRAFVVTGPRVVGIAAVWATRDAAEHAVTPAARRALGDAVGATASRQVLLEAPLLLDATLRRAVEPAPTRGIAAGDSGVTPPELPPAR